MQRTWKQSHKQSVYDIGYVIHKTPRYQKLHGAIGAAAPSASPGSATGSEPECRRIPKSSIQTCMKTPYCTNAHSNKRNFVVRRLSPPLHFFLGGGICPRPLRRRNWSIDFTQKNIRLRCFPGQSQPKI